MHDLKTIGAVSRQYDITLRALRFWEEKGLIAPVRNGVTRLYTPEQVNRIKQIKLLSDAGVPLAEIKAGFEKGSFDHLPGILEELREEAVCRVAAIYRAAENLKRAA